MDLPIIRFEFQVRYELKCCVFFFPSSHCNICLFLSNFVVLKPCNFLCYFSLVAFSQAEGKFGTSLSMSQSTVGIHKACWKSPENLMCCELHTV